MWQFFFFFSCQGKDDPPYALIIVNNNHRLCYSYCLYYYYFHFCFHCYNYYKLLLFTWILSLLNFPHVFQCLSFSIWLFLLLFSFCCYCYNYCKLLLFIWIPSLLNLLGVFRCLSLLIQKVVIIRFVTVFTLDHAIKYPLNFVLPVVWCTYWWHLRISIGCRQVATVGSLTLSTVALAFSTPGSIIIIIANYQLFLWVEMQYRTLPPYLCHSSIQMFLFYAN